MTLGKFAFLAAAFFSLTAESHIQPAVQPGGDIPSKFERVMPAEPSGATLPRTDRALDTARDYFMKNETANVDGVFTVGGFSFAGQGQNAGIAFEHLRDWDERPGKKNSAKEIADRATGALSQYRDALIISFIPPAALELGNATGFDRQLVDRAILATPSSPRRAT